MRHARAGKAWPVALVVALLVVVFESARLGLSGLVVGVAQQEVDRWSGLRRPPQMSEIDRVAKYFSDSLDFAGDNPWALEGLGALDLARVRVSRDPDEALRFATDARIRFRQGLRERPASPFLWANLALSKLYLDEIDAEFIGALRHADQLGPWEPSTQQVVLFAGLAAWDRLGDGERRALTAAVERGGVRNARNMFEIVKSYRRYDLVCNLKAYHVVAGAECAKASEPARIVDKPAARGAR